MMCRRTVLMGIIALFAPASPELWAQSDPIADSRFPTSHVGEFAEPRLVRSLQSPMGLIQVDAPADWQMARDPGFERNLADGLQVDVRDQRDSDVVILRVPSRAVRCDLSVSVYHAQDTDMAGFGSPGGVTFSPEVTYRVLLRGMRLHVEIPLTEYGSTRRFKFMQHRTEESPNLRQFQWEFTSQQGERSFGFGESDLRGETISILTCYWPRGEARGDEATILAAFRNRVSVREDEPQ